MLLGLLLEALFEHFENFLNALFLIALRAQELAELLHCGGRVVEPVHQLLGKLVLIWHAVEVFKEDLVELVVISLGLDEHRATELVKPVSESCCRSSISPSMSVIHSFRLTRKPCARRR